MMVPIAKAALLTEELSSLQPSEDEVDTEAGGMKLSAVIAPFRRWKLDHRVLERLKGASPMSAFP